MSQMPQRVPSSWVNAVNETIAAGAQSKDPSDFSHLVPADQAGKYRIRVVKQDQNSHVAQLLTPRGAVLGSIVGTPTGKSVVNAGGFNEPEISWRDEVPQQHAHMKPWLSQAVHQAWGSSD